jgi:hemoglobin
MKAVTLRPWLMLACCAWFGAAEARPSLYARLGGEHGVAVISNTLIDRVVADPVTGPSFADTKIERIKRLLAEQICDLAGGPCHYSGDPMKEVHAGHHISEAQFYVMVDILRDVLKEQHVDLRARNELLRLLAPMKRDVVESRWHSAPGSH